MNLRGFVDVKSRRKALEDKLGVALMNIGTYSLDEGQASTKNCENMIGVAQVPIGVAGPLMIKGQISQKTKNDYYIPLATTEGALVASVNRGCRVIELSGGASTVSEKVGMSRAPVFVVENILEGWKFAKLIDENFEEIKKLTEATSSHLVLKAIKPVAMGRNVWLRFIFDTGEAMGMNMVTIASASAIAFIEKKTKVKCAAISGNVCVDKKANYFNFVEGRGIKTSADVVIPGEVVSEVLHTSVERLEETARRKLQYGSFMAGSLGANAHFANVLAAVFIATGQDAAHVSECSVGVTTVEAVEKGLYISVYLPDMVAGIVGGGTMLATQREALNIMGFDLNEGETSSQLFSEVIAGAVLAGEISLLGSLAEGGLARAHKKYGRGRI
jgi:hydroxymethylglutaryl-CoA reductase (NADPH)